MPSQRNANATAAARSEDRTDRTRRPRWARLLRLALLCVFCGPDVVRGDQHTGGRPAARERGERHLARHGHR
ncbi:hypothetical protein DL766_008169 [Monosporascus sp. MC13-8B]|uniref:Uncharacterized protein n=1 Tax=Monosporascus cannonballus TaxID=155416 RepID=A0ABY0GRH8_9PEZI|nr:hypothetical protein DL762_010227 [Monosporascus cannonballus]RYO82855.1 hypothetical protein DL763_008087 [Monosporascus cannonballus]RYP20536.1 hypothetical protein DL766_008169 [Monosporascus sp. MC13-8B]